jgi:hypothetical protein
VVAHLGGDAGRLGPPAHHLPGIDAVEPHAVELRLSTTVGANLDGLEEGDPPCIREPGTLYIFGQIALQRVMLPPLSWSRTHSRRCW